MSNQFYLDVFGETILLLVHVPFAQCTLKPVAGVGTASASYFRLDQGSSEVDFSWDISTGVSTQGYFPTRTFFTVETSLIPDGKCVCGEYRHNIDFY
ncbi:hypothetical protein TNCV_4172151 [Trichonephila clavipes]|nr:hypothetical protein TNCV_4172151 [Trichonephila clavipes]